MIINTDINILGGLPDFNLIKHYLFSDKTGLAPKADHYTFTAIKTDKAVKRFEKAITGTFLHFKNPESAFLVRSMLSAESISHDSLYLLYWNASINNELFNYLNSQVYFSSFYSGRLIIRKEEVGACIKDLKETEEQLKEWTIVTIETVASKYLTLLKKFNLMEGSKTKKILHPYLSDKMFVLFIYWLTATESSSNLLESEWLKYCFCEQPIFIERVMQKKFAKFFQLTYTGDKLKIEPTIPYQYIYDGVK
jgi:hypothetical protein